MASIPHQNIIISTQPSFKNDPFNELNGNWNVGLLNCCDDISQCCYAYWCWCCFLCSLAGRIDESKCSCCCVPNALAMYRMKVRSVLRIKGDSCNDHCAALCCSFCAGLQMRNELTYRGLV